MAILAELEAISNQVQAEFGLCLSKADWADARAELIHVFLHEACHAALSSAAPWIDQLPEEDTAVDEVVARLLEDQMAGNQLRQSARSAAPRSLSGPGRG